MTEQIEKAITKDCKLRKCGRWNGHDCTLEAPETGCPYEYGTEVWIGYYEDALNATKRLCPEDVVDVARCEAVLSALRAQLKRKNPKTIYDRMCVDKIYAASILSGAMNHCDYEEDDYDPLAIKILDLRLNELEG